MFEFLEDLFDRPGHGRSGGGNGLLDRFRRRNDRDTYDRWHDDHDDSRDDDERYARTPRDGDRRPRRRRDPDFDRD